MIDWPVLNLTMSILIPLSAGYALVIFLLKSELKEKFLFHIALAYGLGLGLLTHWMLFLAYLKIPFSVNSIGGPLVIFASILLFKFFIKPKTSVFNKHPQQALTESHDHPLFLIFMTLFVGYISTYVFWRSFNVPIINWDAIATVAFRAKLIFFERGFQHYQDLPKPAYPFHVHFAESWVAFNLGQWHDIFIKIIFPFMFLSYLFIQYSFLRQYTNKTWAMLGNVFLCASNFLIYHVTIGYVDFTIMYYNLLTILCLILWQKSNQQGYLWLSALFSGITTFCKIEGVVYLVIHNAIVLFLLSQQKQITLVKKIKPFFSFTFLSWGIFFLYFIYKIIHLNGPVMHGTAVDIKMEYLTRIPTIIKKIIKEMFWLGNWNLLWLLLLVSFLNLKRRIQVLEIKILIFSLFAFLTTNFLLFLCTPVYNFLSDLSLLSRWFLHFFPLIPLLIIFLNAPLSSNQENSI